MCMRAVKVLARLGGCAYLFELSMTDDAMNIKCTNTGLKVIKLEYSLKLKIKRNDWLLADTCPQAADYCALF